MSRRAKTGNIPASGTVTYLAMADVHLTFCRVALSIPCRKAGRQGSACTVPFARLSQCGAERLLFRTQ